MENNMPLRLQEIIYGSSDDKINKQINRWERDGKIKKIAPRIYTGKLDVAPEVIIRRNILPILGQNYKGAVLSHRSAFEFKPTSSGSLFLTYTYTRKIELPGITLRIQKGMGPVEGDNRFIGELFVSQQARAFLENLQVSRRPGPDSKTLSRAELEEKLESIIRVHGEDAINQLRDSAREIAPMLLMTEEFEKLNAIISSLLSTHSSKSLVSGAAKARAIGVPYDGPRVALFEALFAALQQKQFVRRPDHNTSSQSFANTAFYESYFSNYIEGTIFDISEALQIIETQTPIAARDEDSHDILGTFQLVSNRTEMEITPTSGEHLLDILQYRHKILLSARQSKNPGVLKDKDNYAGNTKFVEHQLVRGTLLKAFDFYKILPVPFSKAIFMMFMISEIHPFLDGNGRLARVMMNAELVKAGESKIIIPTVYREDYIGALRKLTRQGDPEIYIRMMQRAHDFSENIYGDSREEMHNYLESCNAFIEDTEGKVLQFTPRYPKDAAGKQSDGGR
ncbi:Fic family protein [Chitinophaga sp. MM2321]|uniref:Fic family protein n=1 Tax=Chitinophaga sp. MM2321 TaxID=3137178 RepID=UPI0032D56F53